MITKPNLESAFYKTLNVEPKTLAPELRERVGKMAQILYDVLIEAMPATEAEQLIASDPLFALLRLKETQQANAQAAAGPSDPPPSAARDINTGGGTYVEGNNDARQGVFIAGGTVQGSVIGTQIVNNISQYIIGGRDVDQLQAIAALFKNAWAPQRLLPDTQLDELLALLDQAGCSAETLSPAYTATRPPEWALWRPTATTARDMVYQLAEAPHPTGGVSPLVSFVQRAADSIDPRASAARLAVAGQLRAWILAQDGKLVISPSARQPAAQIATATDPYLMIKIELDDHDATKAHVQAWLLSDTNPIGSSLYAEDEPRPLSTLEQLLNELLIAASEMDPSLDPAQLLVEILLPRELLCQYVDHWQIAQGRRTVEAGRKYQVVVRSVERVYDPQMKTTWSDWRSKWRLIKPRPGAEAPLKPVLQQPIFWPSTEKFDLFTKLGQQGVVCLALTEVPTAVLAGTLDDALNTAFDAGTPISLWYRQSVGSPEEMRQKLEVLLATGLADLPRRIWELRQEAAQSPDEMHYGKHLALLWDDYDHLPPDVRPSGQLGAPIRQRSEP